MRAISLAASFVLLAACSDKPTKPDPGPDPDPTVDPELTLTGCAQWDPGLVWCSAEVKDNHGLPVTDLVLSDFTVTETSFSGVGDEIETREVTFDAHPSYQFGGAGFWERSVSDHVVDIVFLIDLTGTMVEEAVGIRSQLHVLVDELEARHLDYRIALVPVDWHVRETRFEPLRGVTGVAEIRTAIDQLDSWGEWWIPASLYDALLVVRDNTVDGLQFRPAADKHIVVITDSVAATPYGSQWYFSESTGATSSAVDLLYDDSDIRIHYSQAPGAGDPDSDRSIESYCRENLDGEQFTPKACGASAGFESFGQPPLAWPFAAANLLTALNLDSGDVVSSKYFFAWQSDLDRSGLELDREIEVTISTDEPLSDSTRLPLLLERQDWTLQANTEDGQTVNRAEVSLVRLMGDREVEVETAVLYDSSHLIEDLHCGDYELRIEAYGPPSYGYHQLRYELREPVSVCGDAPATHSTTFYTADQTADLARARGLVHELRRWGSTDRPFVNFADRADTWLDSLPPGGMSWVELESLRRFTAGLSGFINTNGYVEQQIPRAAKDFLSASKQLRDIAKRMGDAGDGLDGAINNPATLAQLAAYVAESNTAAVEKHTELEALVEAVKAYVINDLLPDALVEMSRVLSENLRNQELATQLMLLATEIAFGDWDNLGEVLERMAPTLLEEALQEVFLQVAAEVLAPMISAEIDAALQAEVDLPDEVRSLVKAAVEAFLNEGFAGFEGDFETSMATMIDDARTRAGSKETLLALVADAFTAINGTLEPSPVRDLAMPLVEVFVRVIIESRVDGNINDDYVIEVFARMFCDWVMVRPFYAEPLKVELDALLIGAQGFTATGDNYARRDAMSAAYSDFWSDTMIDLNSDAWSALSTQASIDSWEDWIGVAQTVLGLLEVATTTACLYYPQVCEYVDDINNLMIALDALRAMTNVLEFGLKLDSMAHLAGGIADAPVKLYP